MHPRRGGRWSSSSRVHPWHTTSRLPVVPGRTCGDPVPRNRLQQFDACLDTRPAVGFVLPVVRCSGCLAEVLLRKASDPGSLAGFEAGAAHVLDADTLPAPIKAFDNEAFAASERRDIGARDVDVECAQELGAEPFVLNGVAHLRFAHPADYAQLKLEDVRGCRVIRQGSKRSMPTSARRGAVRCRPRRTGTSAATGCRRADAPSHDLQ